MIIDTSYVNVTIHNVVRDGSRLGPRWTSLPSRQTVRRSPAGPVRRATFPA